MDDGYYLYKDDDLKQWGVLQIRDGGAFLFGHDYPFDIDKLGVEIGDKILMPHYY